jgi:hypothetical protein
VPPDAGFATKPKLAPRVIARAIAASVPFKWVAGDTVYGGWRYRTVTASGRQRLRARVNSAHVFRSWGKRPPARRVLFRGNQLTSIPETSILRRKVVRRDGGVQASKWQAVLRTTPHAFKSLLIHPIDKFLIGSNAQRGWCCQFHALLSLCSNHKGL